MMRPKIDTALPDAGVALMNAGMDKRANMEDTIFVFP